MKKISSVISLSFLVLLLLVGCNKSSSDWVKYRDDNDGNVYSYKKVNIQKDKNDYIVQVWIKKVYSDKGRKIQPPPPGQWIDDIDSMDLNEIDCKKQRIRILSSIIYDTDGRESSKKDYDNSKWDHIVPDSNDENLLKIVCK